MNVGEDVLLFYNDKQSFQALVRMMKETERHSDTNSALNYHITLVQLLANCTEGKNVTTEMKCISLLPLDDIVKVVTDPDCTPQVCFSYFIIYDRFWFEPCRCYDHMIAITGHFIRS